jgi:TldD protein
MALPFQADPSAWDRAVEEAVRTLAARSPEVTVFQEDRLDWRLSVRGGRAIERVRSRSAGAAFDPGGDAEGFWVSATSPDDLIRRAEGEDPGFVVQPCDPGNWPDPFSDLERTILLLAPAGDVVVTAAGFHQTIRIGRGDGPPERDVRRGAWIRVEAFGPSATGVAEAVVREDPTAVLRRLIAEAMERSRARADARPVDAGGEVAVFAPGVGGLLIHESIGHALEGDTVARGRSWLATRGAVVGPREMTVVDDPRRGRAAWRRDDEGVEARATTLVRGGRVEGVLLDRRCARARTTESTGHGRRSSFRDPVRPRMGATFLAAGAWDARDVVASTERGVYVRRMSSGRSDPATGTATFRVTDADSIDRGRLSRPVRPFLMTVTPGPAGLSIDGIATEVVFDTCIGSCLRAGQPLSTSVGAPTFRLGSIRIVPAEEEAP